MPVFTLFVMLFVMMGLPACRSLPPVASVAAVFDRDLDTGALIVREVAVGGAAELGGLQRGDHIKMIDGLLVDGHDRDRIRTLLRGAVGTRVSLTVLRGHSVYELVIVRAATRPRVGPAR